MSSWSPAAESVLWKGGGQGSEGRSAQPVAGRMKDDSQVSTSRLEDGAIHWDGDTEGDTDGGGGEGIRFEAH